MARLPLEKRFLEDEEAARLYRSFPELKASYEKYCPTCNKTGKYLWKGEVRDCDCQSQLQLHKWYLSSGIGRLYQTMDWDDFHGDPGLKTSADFYIEYSDRLIKNGIGAIFMGQSGLGKTLVSMLIGKKLVRDGYTVFATTFSAMVEMFTAGWTSQEDKQFFEKKIVKSTVLILDDLGKEMRNKSKLSETTFDNLLRSRVQNGRPTIITTNMLDREIREGYGSSVMSLLMEVSIPYVVKGSDYRRTAGSKRVEEVTSGITRPIV